MRAVVDRRVKKTLADIHRYIEARTPANRGDSVFRRHVKNCLPDLYKAWQAI